MLVNFDKAFLDTICSGVLGLANKCLRSETIDLGYPSSLWHFHQNISGEYFSDSIAQDVFNLERSELNLWTDEING